MLQRIRGFRLLDDDFMTKCFEENKEATELVLVNAARYYKEDKEGISPRCVKQWKIC